MNKKKESMIRWFSVLIAVCVPSLTFIWYLSSVSSKVYYNSNAIQENKISINRLSYAIQKEKSQLAVIEERTGSIKETVKIILSDIKELRKK